MGGAGSNDASDLGVVKKVEVGSLLQCRFQVGRSGAASEWSTNRAWETLSILR